MRLRKKFGWWQGRYRTAGLQQRLEELEARKATLEQELAADPPPPVRLHPNLAQVYRGKVERLHEPLADPGLRDEAVGILRGLIERVVLHPGEDGLQVELVGEIVKMIELGLDTKKAALPSEAACSVKVVAGEDLDFVHFSWHRALRRSRTARDRLQGPAVPELRLPRRHGLGG